MMKYYTIIFTLFSFASIYDTTLLWRINVNPPAYLLGTAHLPYTYLWPSLSNTAKSAFYNSTHFFPEFDITNFFSFTRFRMCLNSNMPPGANSPPPPGFMGQRGPQAPLLDIYLILEAHRMRKNVASLESVEMYCEFTKFQVEGLTQNFTTNVDKPLLLTESANEEVKRAYNCDFNHHEEFLTPPKINIQDRTLLAFKQRLDNIVNRRDSQMTQTIDYLLKRASPNDRFFFAVGFLHLMSPDGIIAKLRRDYKYSVTRLCTDPPHFRVALRCQGPSWCDPISGL